jgi:hypothetical protein
MYQTQVIKGLLQGSVLAQIQQGVLHYDSSHDVVTAPIGRYIGVSSEVDQVLKSLIPTLPNEVLFTRILEATTPGGPHADNGLPTPLPPNYVMPRFGRTFIIPLTTQPTHTVVFDQAMPLGVSIYDHMESLAPLDPGRAVGAETGQRLLTHTGRAWLDRLSIDCIFPWQAGDMLVFDRSRIHCSDNWAITGLEDKRGFVIWSEIQA